MPVALFLDLDPADNPDIRLGCLRYYWRDHSTQTFTGTLESAALVQCTKRGNGLMQTQTVTNGTARRVFGPGGHHAISTISL